jgi:transposase
MEERKRYSKEVQERAVRLVLDNQAQYQSQWKAIQSIAMKIGCTPESLRRWVRQAEIDDGTKAGQTRDDKTRIKELEREVRELRKANEIIRLASAYFAKAELDRPNKK